MVVGDGVLLFRTHHQLLRLFRKGLVPFLTGAVRASELERTTVIIITGQ
jgi:hypothetical protein